MARNRVIGVENRLPWRLPADLGRFKRLTMGHVIIMGRKTHESIGRPLPGRRTIVLSRDPGYRAEGVAVAGSLEAALERCEHENEVFVVGGEAVYREALPLADRLYVTWIDADVEGDVLFPPFDIHSWRLCSEESPPRDDDTALPFSFRVYERR
jgi:dihydrofolate reductase